MDVNYFFIFFILCELYCDAINKLCYSIDIPCMIHLSIKKYDDVKIIFWFHPHTLSFGFPFVVHIKIILKKKEVREN